MLLYAAVSSFREHASTLNTVFHVNACNTRHCSSIYICYCYIYILIHPTLLFYDYEPQIHRFTVLLDTMISYICTIATWIICTQLFHIHTPLLHRFTSIHALIISVLLLHGSPFILHELLLHGYSCIHIT